MIELSEQRNYPKQATDCHQRRKSNQENDTQPTPSLNWPLTKQNRGWPNEKAQCEIRHSNKPVNNAHLTFKLTINIRTTRSYIELVKLHR